MYVKVCMMSWLKYIKSSVADPKIFSISCICSENLVKLYVGAPPPPPPPRVGAPPTGNPGSAPDHAVMENNQRFRKVHTDTDSYDLAIRPSNRSGRTLLRSIHTKRKCRSVGENFFDVCCLFFDIFCLFFDLFRFRLM